jgi:hypothetical protein
VEETDSRMSKFGVAWPRKHVAWKRQPRGELWIVEAVLLERRIGAQGQPCMQCICKLAGIDENEAHPNGAIQARDAFWHHASARLGRLFRLNDHDLDEIEACIAERIGPRPLPEAVQVKVQAAE